MIFIVLSPRPEKSTQDGNMKNPESMFQWVTYPVKLLAPEKEKSQKKTKSPETANNIIKRNPDAQVKRSFDSDIDADPAFNNYEMSTDENATSFDVEIKEFEREFTLWKI